MTTITLFDRNLVSREMDIETDGATVLFDDDRTFVLGANRADRAPVYVEARATRIEPKRPPETLKW
jgi:hypothetical protein